MKKSFLAALILGAATVGGFAPFEFFPLPFVTLTLLFLLWRGAQTPKYAALIGFAWGLGFFLTGVSWVYVSLHDVGGMALPIAAGATLFFCFCLACFPALAGYVCKRFATTSAWRNALLLAGVWTLIEWSRTWVATGFPWLSLAYSQVGPSPLGGYAPVLGSYGVGFTLALISALVACGWWRYQFLLAIAALLTTGALLKQIHWTEAVGRPVTVSLLQGNIPQSIKWDPARLSLSYDTYLRLAHEHPAQLMVLPETAIPLLYEEIPPGYLRDLANNSTLLLGAAMRREDGEYLNGALVLQDGKSQGRYAKTHLVPFGEYIPPGFAWFFSLVNIPMSDFAAGGKQQKPLDIAGLKVAVNICYEDMFGEEIIRQLPEATVLINLSNTAWFGHSLAQPQHLQGSRMRAMETGRPMLRATNTGMTAAIAPDGSVSAVLSAFTEDALTLDVQGYSGTTPYVLTGNIPVLLFSVLGLIPALRYRKSP